MSQTGKRANFNRRYQSNRFRRQSALLLSVEAGPPAREDFRSDGCDIDIGMQGDTPAATANKNAPPGFPAGRFELIKLNEPASVLS